MITQAQIRKKALRLWNSGVFLTSCIEDTTIFPVTIRFRTPSGKELLENFDVVRSWIKTLRRHSKEEIDHGYEIVWQTIHHRQLGDQQLPKRILFSTQTDWLAFIQKKREHDIFVSMVDQTTNALPELLPYLSQKPLKTLGHAAHWQTILTVCAWFMEHPLPGKYIRQLDIAGVDTKFIETHMALLMDLLPLVVKSAHVDKSITGLSKHGFERKFGLLYDPPLVRMRLLDPDLVPFGLTDLTVPLDLLAQLDPGANRVFITENKINGLAFPQVPQSMVIFGLGYGVEMLRKIDWLRNKEIYYWGDIDTHGFAILSQIRGYFHQVKAFLMDRDTFFAHESLWGAETPEKRFVGTLTHLNPAEEALFDNLKENRFAPHLRLEQERIRFSALIEALKGFY